LRKDDVGQWMCVLILYEYVPSSPSAREQFRDGTGETPGLVFLHCVPGTSICGLPGITLLCSGQTQPSQGDPGAASGIGVLRTSLAFCLPFSLARAPLFVFPLRPRAVRPPSSNESESDPEFISLVAGECLGGNPARCIESSA
jgi:hypothetical protein